MKIDTVFNVGDYVWIINENKVVQDKIIKISILIENKTNVLITFEFERKGRNNFEVTGTTNVFSTKQELISSL